FIRATVLYILAASSSKSTFKACLQKDNIEINSRDLDGNTLLLLIIRENH
ncbi:hypothetical protein CC78DRAFT_472679, partial [Lojkania enalia]